MNNFKFIGLILLFTISLKSGIGQSQNFGRRNSGPSTESELIAILKKNKLDTYPLYRKNYSDHPLFSEFAFIPVIFNKDGHYLSIFPDGGACSDFNTYYSTLRYLSQNGDQNFRKDTVILQAYKSYTFKNPEEAEDFFTKGIEPSGVQHHLADTISINLASYIPELIEINSKGFDFNYSLLPYIVIHEFTLGGRTKKAIKSLKMMLKQIDKANQPFRKFLPVLVSLDLQDQNIQSFLK